MLLLKPNPASGVPIYVQLMEQIRHAVETGAMRPGDQLPGMRKVAEDLVVNPNTVAKVYRELEHEGLIELRQGMGAFVRAQAGEDQGAQRFRLGQPIVKTAVAKLRALGLDEDEIRRLTEAELVHARAPLAAAPTPKPR